MGYPILAQNACNALGDGLEQIREALACGRSGLTPCPLELPFETLAGALPIEPAPLPSALARSDTRLARLMAHIVTPLQPLIDQLIERYGAHRLGLFVGTSTAGIGETEAAHAALVASGELPAEYDYVAQHGYGTILGVLRRLTGVAGPGSVASTACTSSVKGLGTALRMLDAGWIDAALVGGGDTMCHTTLRGFHGLSVLARDGCRPFSAERRGMCIGEGGALMLLAREGEGAVELLGVGESCDAFHLTSPEPEGGGAALAMRRALASAGLEPCDIGHINAHGTGTRRNDAMETAAILEVFAGCDVSVASTKAFTGHLLGGAGATEAVFAAMALEDDAAPISLGTHPPDPELPLRFCRGGEPIRPRRALSNSFAFGGNNTSVILGARS